MLKLNQSLIFLLIFTLVSSFLAYKIIMKAYSSDDYAFIKEF